MNQKTFKLKIAILVLFLIGFQIGILNNIPTFTRPEIDDKKEDRNPITSSTGWEPEILGFFGWIYSAWDVCVGDANNDGYNDIVSAGDYQGSSNGKISILLWNPVLEDWHSYTEKILGGLGFSVAIGDANNDGYNDIVAGWFSGASPRISLYYWNSTIQNWNNRITKGMTARPGNVLVGDINNDGYNDVLVGGYGSSVFSCFFWNNTISDWDPEVTRNLSSISDDIYFGDANNDGFNDVVVSLTATTDKTEIFTWNDTSENWNAGILKSVGDYPWSVFINDANNDGFNDIIVGNTGNDKDISLFIWNVTKNDWNSEIQLPISNSGFKVFVDDVNNDGLNDIVSVHAAELVSILLSYIESPILDTIVPAVDIDGGVGLNWSDVDGITHYYVFRNTSFITSIDGMTPLDSVIDSNYTDFLSMNDEYYYVVIASDVNGNSSISYCESVNVSVPLEATDLSLISTNPDFDGTIDLDWDDVERATSYLIYRNTSFISSVNSLTPIDTSTESNYIDSVPANDIYYYAIIATDGSIVSSISNCENVTVSMPLTEPNLLPISPNPDHDGVIYLEWIVPLGATIYYIYRDFSSISSVISLAPIDTTTDIYYHDSILSNGTYHYVIVAGDGIVNSSISNCENVTIDLSLDIPNLDVITPNPNFAGVVDLNWDDIEGATRYYIFRDRNPIVSPNTLNPIQTRTIIVSNFTDTLHFNGIYYYAIVAGNGVLNSTLSSNQEVSILMPLDDPHIVNVNEYGNSGVIIEWDVHPNATLYYLYRDDVFITSIDLLDPIGVTSDLSYIDNPSNSGDYYYVVVATDDFVNSSISNVGSIHFEYAPPPPGIPGFNIYLIITSILLCGILIVIRKYKKKF